MTLVLSYEGEKSPWLRMEAAVQGSMGIGPAGVGPLYSQPTFSTQHGSSGGSCFLLLGFVLVGWESTKVTRGDLWEKHLVHRDVWLPGRLSLPPVFSPHDEASLTRGRFGREGVPSRAPGPLAGLPAGATTRCCLAPSGAERWRHPQPRTAPGRVGRMRLPGRGAPSASLRETLVSTA